MVMNIRVLTPDRVICSTTADEVILPGLTGQIGILDGHATLITALDTGLLRIKASQKWTPIVLCGGLAEVEDNQITILVSEIEEIPLIELAEANKRVEVAMASYDQAETAKSKYETYLDLKKALAILEGINYLSLAFDRRDNIVSKA